MNYSRLRFSLSHAASLVKDLLERVTWPDSCHSSLLRALSGLVLVSAASARGATHVPVKALPGFQVEVAYSVPREQGSWVSMAVDPKGRLITSDQFGRLYRVTLRDGSPLTAEAAPLEVQVGSAQGLLWAFDSLYVVVNREEKNGGSGLYRLRDRDGDDQFEEARLLRAIKGGGEHGPHAILPGPDGRSLYLLAGNATDLPAPEASRVPRQWGMDMLLPHLEQTDGVWRTNRPGGWICRLDADGREFEVFAVGLRNPYDMAFNADGELFTFDADMEWDLGTPWYRPTRVNHVTSGAEFGWRTGSSKWPDYYGDSLPSVLDVGESSPTGLAFGYGARFPAKYQRALFMGDWSYGKIYALHLEPRGATYQATLEPFLAGSPLPVTDLLIRPQDGALYFLTGGRGTLSIVYRVIYRGEEPTMAVNAKMTEHAPLRDLRRRLERFHGRTDPEAVTVAWPYLGHADRAVRYAARLALEHQPVIQWRERALAESKPRVQLTALMALARCGSPAGRSRLIARLVSLDWSSLNDGERLDLVRIAALACIRLGKLEENDRQSILKSLNSRFPAGSYELNRELSQLLIYLDAPAIVDRSLTAMETAPSQEEQLHYALGLRTCDLNSWSNSQRERFFGWLAKAGSAGGGVTYGTYLDSIRSEALGKLNDIHAEALRPLLVRKPPVDPYLELKQRNLVREWTVSDLLPPVASGMQHRNFEQGRRVYSTAMCIKCHRFNRQGGLTGPDLTGVGNRFDDRTLLESILEPSKVVSDQYATVEVRTKDGEQYTGRIGDQLEHEILLKADLLNPANIKRIRWKEIESIVPSALSLMPTGLLDYFTRDEILDLIAYLKSQGDSTGSIFARP